MVSACSTSSNRRRRWSAFVRRWGPSRRTSGSKNLRSSFQRTPRCRSPSECDQRRRRVARAGAGMQGRRRESNPRNVPPVARLGAVPVPTMAEAVERAQRQPEKVRLSRMALRPTLRRLRSAAAAPSRRPRPPKQRRHEFAAAATERPASVASRAILRRSEVGGCALGGAQTPESHERLPRLRPLLRCRPPQLGPGPRRRRRLHSRGCFDPPPRPKHRPLLRARVRGGRRSTPKVRHIRRPSTLAFSTARLRAAQ